MLKTMSSASDFTVVPGPQAPAPAGVGDYYRTLFQQLRASFGGLENSGRALGITSSAVGEGVTTVCQNLAVCAAQQLSRPVLLIDADLSGSQSSQRTTTRGLYDVLARGAEPADCVKQSASRNVYVLSAGIPAPRAARGAQPFPKDAFVQLLNNLKREFRFIVVDLPTANEITDCLSICGLLDGVLLVVEAERIRSHVIAHARDHLFQAGAKVMGIVFNKRRNHVPEWLYRRL